MRKSTAVAALVVAFMSFAAHAQGERIWRPDGGLTGGDPTRSTDPNAIAALKCARPRTDGRSFSFEANKGVDANGGAWCKSLDEEPYYLDWYDHIHIVIYASVNTCAPGQSPSPDGSGCKDNPDAKKNTGPKCPCTPKPINPAVGNKFKVETDYRGHGPFPLKLERTYNSAAVAMRAGGFGSRWTHQYERSLHSGFGGALAATNTSVIVERPDGAGYLFVKSGAVFKADTDVPYTLSVSAGIWTLTDDRDTVETYDSTGKLLSITQRNGLRQTLAYDATNQLITVSDDYGRTLQFTYDAKQRISRVTDPAGGAHLYSYNEVSNMLETVRFPGGALRRYHHEVGSDPTLLTGISDENGVRYETYGYDTQGRPVSTVLAGGANPISVSYNAAGASVTDANGTAVQLNFASNHALVKNNAASGRSSGTNATAAATTYDANGYVASRTDFGGSVTTYIHDTRGLETSRTEAFGTLQARTITTQWHATLRLPTRVTEPGRETTYTYDAQGNRLSKSVRDTATNSTRTTTWTYNAVGQVLSMDGPRSDVNDATTYAYDAQGNLSQVTNALGQTTAFTDHDAHGNPTRIVDANGVVTTMAYDARQRLTSRTVAGATTAFEYDAVGQLIKVTQPGGAFLEYAYDDAHRLVGVEDNFGNRIAYTLDAAGNRIAEQVFDPYGALARSRARTFDALNQLTRDADGTGRGTGFTYDAEGKRTATTDDLGRSTGFAYDALDRLTQTTDAAMGLTRYAYDARGNLIQVIDSRGVTTNYAYDGFDGVTATISPDAGTTSYAYDAAGNRAQQTDARGITATFEYDALNRLAAVRYPNPAENVVYGYDEGTNGVGRLTSITDPSGQTRYSYDAHGNVVSDSRTIGSTTLVTHYAYDAADRLISMTYPSGRTVSIDRDATGRISDLRLAGLMGQDLATSLLHEPFGPVAGLMFGNGLALSRQFDLGGRLTAQSAGTVQQLGWSYDVAGNIIGLSDGAHPDRDQGFGYDALDRLTQASGAYGSQQFQYDAVGNRVQLTDDGSTTSYGYAADSNRLLNAGAAQYQYDAAGNTTFDGLNHFAFNQANRLISVTRGSDAIASYTYNALGQRVRKAAGTTPPDYSALIAQFEAEAAEHSANATSLTAQASDLTDQAAAQEALAQQQRAAQDAFLAEAAAQYALEAEYRADTTADELRAEAQGAHAAALSAEASATSAQQASIAATQASLALGQQAADAEAQATATSTQASMLSAQAAQAETDATAQEALAVYLSQAASDAHDEAATQLALEVDLRAQASALLAGVQEYLDKAAWFRSRKISPIKKPQDLTFNTNMERQAQHFEGLVGDTTAQIDALLVLADAAHVAALEAQELESLYETHSIAATLAAISLHAQADAALAQASALEQQAAALLAQADALSTESAAQEALAIEHQESSDTYLAQAQDLYADEQELLAAAEAADLTDEADAAHAAALAATASAAQAEQLSVASTQEALALIGQADALAAQSATETQLAQAAQAQADYYAALRDQPGTFAETLFVYDLSGHLIGEYAVDGSLKVEYAWLEDMPLAQLREGSTLGGTTVYWYQADHLNTPTQLTDLNRKVVWDAVREPFGKTETVTSTVSNDLRFPGQYHDAETSLDANARRTFDNATGRFSQPDPLGLFDGANPYLAFGAAPTQFVDVTGLYKCTYSISQASMSCVANDPAHPNFQSDNYTSGNNLGNTCKDCQDNPDKTDQRDHGPLPVGKYTIEEPIAPGSARRGLTPDSTNTMHGRSGFQLHGCGDAYTCSKGCIAATTNATRDTLNARLALEEGFNTLEVTP